ncbi:S-adenosylmethionine:tRNA ribosyltransferase-isomerase [Dyadobacter tibetensis]|uniref:S-adenosylmethionine:tRNA ribosyltransferase-isomerase n=1 Tax=Dyadobacter tibetensis TaxID=1211851 RepID=UPI00046F3554|nr:S-adenosylmethionine:tRNA ribosyltransferase-isomerase [Dyadobacter tibetensis]
MKQNWLEKAEGIRLSDYTYNLPDERVAKYPLAHRDQSKLLVYRQGKISHHQFDELPVFLPKHTLLVFNDTRVIPARAHFTKDTGASIELLLLHPEWPTRIINEAMLVQKSSVWACMIGNKKRWKAKDTLHTELVLNGQSVALTARYEDVEKNLVRFDWESGHDFLEVVKALGEIPLPPYLHRDAQAEDTLTYQTVYARQDGAVAAPTAGLHFTDRVFDALAHKAIDRTYLTLHVGAGTFQPIKVDTVTEHHMHSEQIVFTRKTIEDLQAHAGQIVPVGTTSMRSLESLYWYGVKLLRKETTEFFIEKLYPYPLIEQGSPQLSDSLGAILAFMEERNMEEIVGETEIFIFPGYKFQICKGLVTNFHQPGSTLLLLIAALIGDSWRSIYDQAMEGNYRFLSYGDSSLLWAQEV